MLQDMALLCIALLALLIVPCRCEGSIKLCLSRTVAMGKTWGRVQLVAAFVPYRHNRVYYRAAIARV